MQKAVCRNGEETKIHAIDAFHPSHSNRSLLRSTLLHETMTIGEAQLFLWSGTQVSPTAAKS
jgi:hypothetical protein